MYVEHLWLTDFRSYTSAELAPVSDGLTVVDGANGEGKTNLIEAVAYLATQRSMRGAPTEALVRSGADSGTVRANIDREGRALLIEAELKISGRDRFQVNRQPLKRARDLAGHFAVTVFAPDDLALIKGGPAERRSYLDDLLVSLHPRHEAARVEVDRSLRQRNALLKSAGGRMTPDVVSTLDVWDAKLSAAGEALVSAREGLVNALGVHCAEAYGQLGASTTKAGRDEVGLRYMRSWTGDLHTALGQARAEDLRRGTTTVGPQRDELLVEIGGTPARTHASQGEQRSMALALRLAGHAVVTGRIGTPPVLLLDDVFSELDSDRSAALARCLPPGQAILTTAGEMPPGLVAAMCVTVASGELKVGFG